MIPTFPSPMPVVTAPSTNGFLDKVQVRIIADEQYGDGEIEKLFDLAKTLAAKQ